MTTKKTSWHISECPICGEELQATLEHYTTGVTIDREGNAVDTGDYVGHSETGRIYCRNDHTLEAILQELTEQEAVTMKKSKDKTIEEKLQEAEAKVAALEKELAARKCAWYFTEQEMQALDLPDDSQRAIRTALARHTTIYFDRMGEEHLADVSAYEEEKLRWVRENMDMVKAAADSVRYKLVDAAKTVKAEKAKRSLELPRVQTLGSRSTSFGRVTYLKIATPDKRRLSWREVWERYADLYPDSWAIQFFPPKSELVDDAHIYHLFVLEDEPRGFGIIGGRTSTYLEGDHD